MCCQLRSASQKSHSKKQYTLTPPYFGFKLQQHLFHGFPASVTVFHSWTSSHWLQVKEATEQAVTQAIRHFLPKASGSNSQELLKISPTMFPLVPASEMGSSYGRPKKVLWYGKLKAETFDIRSLYHEWICHKCVENDMSSTTIRRKFQNG